MFSIFFYVLQAAAQENRMKKNQISKKLKTINFYLNLSANKKHINNIKY
jgi:hypothetical protein